MMRGWGQLMWPPQVTPSSRGHLAQSTALINGPWVEEIPHIPNLFMASDEPPSPEMIDQGGNKSWWPGHCSPATPSGRCGCVCGVGKDDMKVV